MASTAVAPSSGRSKILPWSLIGIGAFLIAAALTLVFFVVPSEKKTPLDIDALTVTEVDSGTVLVGKAFATKTPTEMNADRLSCKTPESESDGDKPADSDDAEKTEDVALPMSCFMDSKVPLYSQRRVQIVEPSDADEVTFQAAQSLIRKDKMGSRGDDGLINASIDRITYDRQSALPVDRATSTLALTSSGTPSRGKSPTPFEREGIQYKFPFDTPKGDIEYFDTNTFQTYPISYKEDEEVNGLKTYRYEMNVGPINQFKAISDHFTEVENGYSELAKSILASYRIKGKAGQWGLAGDEDRDVTMDRYYTNTREVWVNPTSGQIVFGREKLFMFFAENDEQANKFFDDKAAVAAEEKNPTRTALKFVGSWDQGTIDRTSDIALRIDRKIATFGVTLPLIFGTLGTLLLLGGLVLGLRARSARGEDDNLDVREHQG